MMTKLDFGVIAISIKGSNTMEWKLTPFKFLKNIFSHHLYCYSANSIDFNVLLDNVVCNKSKSYLNPKMAFLKKDENDGAFGSICSTTEGNMLSWRIIISILKYSIISL